MRTDHRLSRVLHLLLHMHQADGPLTSEKMAELLETNPGVVRRTMAGLRDAGYVAAEKGHGGGWTLVTPLQELSLWGVYEALGEPRLFTLGASEGGGGCALERAADAALDAGLGAAKAAFTSHLKNVTLADLFADAERRRGAPVGARRRESSRGRERHTAHD